MIDIHSHIMPEMDDGARSVEEAVKMAEIAARDGIEQMVSTPHMFNGLSHNPDPSEIMERVMQLQEAIGNTLRILPGNEVHVSHEIAEQAKTRRVMLINNRNYMLVEFPQLTVPIGADELFYKLQLQSVYPILVHPERNAQIQSRPSDCRGICRARSVHSSHRDERHRRVRARPAALRRNVNAS